MIRYKVGIIDELRERGYTGYALVHDKVLYAANLQALRRGKLVSWAVLDKLCGLLDCQPGDLVEYVRGGDGQ